MWIVSLLYSAMSKWWWVGCPSNLLCLRKLYCFERFLILIRKLHFCWWNFNFRLCFFFIFFLESEFFFLEKIRILLIFEKNAEKILISENNFIFIKKFGKFDFLGKKIVFGIFFGNFLDFLDHFLDHQFSKYIVHPTFPVLYKRME